MAWSERGDRKGARRMPEKLRREVIKRDRKMGRGCWFLYTDICLGIDQPRVQVHHIIDAEDDGPDDLDNLVTACTPCHVRYSARVSQKRSVAKQNEWKRKPEKHPGVLD
ncbi:HNH endonuclease [Mycobacterium phage Tesla]|uniref:HNH endonuclease n=9 Tax=Marvinvirus TaxID=1982091 RepID=A0A3S9U9A4_9CAUD|nr:HNH endonuclease [Mycobacterium phage MosMoris]ANM46313.1 HNH endonuclease [Mycobacterium phage Gattaca]AVE00834.1 HNH endonuclease [Mycobacterium phage Tesla]AYB70722.1 HNH endonuclease [Mycobacterium phage VasuNzinga]AZS06858.1 HNH endonuclease [Mycobacterium phage Raela]QAX93143.1 HNH endonuclease [Mycobacterium phage RedRaider77]QBQ71383.1 HNH endonuclease [Mycobacterium phage Blackbeetle]QFP94229.1 HNH endonuclease [Mycobacterium phage JoieB]QFP94419.1 HNH endonuclease [Mycobacteriu